MNVKVLNYVDYNSGKIMNTFVLKEEANLQEITKTVDRVFWEKEAEVPYCDIVRDLYGHLLLNVVENETYDW